MSKALTISAFNAAGKTITVDGFDSANPINPSFVGIIENQTVDPAAIIYKFGDTLNFTVSDNVITFTGSNAGMMDTDNIVIQYLETKSLKKIEGTIDASTTLPFATGGAKCVTFIPTSSDPVSVYLQGSNDEITWKYLKVIGGINYNWSSDADINYANKAYIGGFQFARFQYGLSYPSSNAAIEAYLNPELEIIGSNAMIPYGTNEIGSIIDITGTIPLPTGASTEASLVDISAKLPASLGPKAGSDSLSIIPASDADLASETTLIAFSDKISSGSTFYKRISTTSTNEDVVKNSGGSLFNIIAMNSGIALAYLKFYNLATTPNIGVDVPIATIEIPFDTQGNGLCPSFSPGVKFDVGIAIAITAGIEDDNADPVPEKKVSVTLAYE